MSHEKAQFISRFPQACDDLFERQDSTRGDKLWAAEEARLVRRILYACPEPHCSWQKFGEEEDLRDHVRQHIDVYKARARWLEGFVSYERPLPTGGRLYECPIQDCLEIFLTATAMGKMDEITAPNNADEGFWTHLTVTPTSHPLKTLPSSDWDKIMSSIFWRNQYTDQINYDACQNDSESDVKPTCPITDGCSATFERWEHLIRHILTCHRRFECRVLGCETVWNRKDKWVDHMRGCSMKGLS